MKNSRPTIEDQRRMVREWNATYPVGTRVTRYRFIHPMREPVNTRTRSEAWMMGDHTAVIQVEDVDGAVALEGVRPSHVSTPEDLNTAFSNGKWAVNVATCGQLIDELSRLPRDLPVRLGFADTTDVVVLNRKTTPHVSFSEGGDWTKH